jgi:hypothetical protein
MAGISLKTVRLVILELDGNEMDDLIKTLDDVSTMHMPESMEVLLKKLKRVPPSPIPAPGPPPARDPMPGPPPAQNPVPWETQK